MTDPLKMTLGELRNALGLHDTIAAAHSARNERIEQVCAAHGYAPHDGPLVDWLNERLGSIKRRP
jgi:hypothetical protein